MKQRSESELLHLAASYCSASERCIYDVEKKITSYGGSPEVAERIIACLLKEKFIDESRFCHSYVNDKFRFNHWGRIRIRYELQKKGIAPTLLTSAFDHMNEENYIETLSGLLRDKKRTTKGHSQQDIFNKLYRFASGRGFESDLITKCLKPLFKENNDTDNLD